MGMNERPFRLDDVDLVQLFDAGNPEVWFDRPDRPSPPFVDDFAPCLFLFNEALCDPDHWFSSPLCVLSKLKETLEIEYAWSKSRSVEHCFRWFCPPPS